MPYDPIIHSALGDAAARQLANATKTVPQMSSITPRWLVHCLQWVPVEAGIYRRNRVKDASSVAVDCSGRDERGLPETFVDYEENPREYMLSAVNTVLDVHTRVSDLYSSPYNQIGEQLRLTIETIKERQESELINNAEYGLLHNVAPSMRISTAHRRADARRSGRADRPGLEGAGVLPGPSRGDRRLRPRMHVSRRAAANRHPVRLAVPHLAGDPADPVRQAADRRRQDQHPAAADGRSQAGRRRPLSAQPAGRAEHGAVGPLHGDQPQGDRLLPGLALLLAGGADR